jgi:predicted GNAT superfamily acetyltransferase
MAVTLRALHALDDFRRVVALEEEIWGTREETVPATVFAATVPRGGVLVGAFDEADLVGFAYSFPAVVHGRLIHWSHMTGVTASHRNAGLALRLKLAQRERVLRSGIGRIDWTFDPLQAANAHFNLRRLGVVVEHYEVNVYGELVNPLHGGIPTDRLVAQWWLDAPRVRALADDQAVEPPAVSTSPAHLVNPLIEVDGWMTCDWNAVAAASQGRLRVAIPERYTEMLASAPETALRWRLAARRLFQTVFAAGYRVTDFARAPGGGTYLLEQAVE